MAGETAKSAGKATTATAVALAQPVSAPAPEDVPSVERDLHNEDILPAKGKSLFRFRR